MTRHRTTPWMPIGIMAMLAVTVTPAAAQQPTFEVRIQELVRLAMEQVAGRQQPSGMKNPQGSTATLLPVDNRVTAAAVVTQHNDNLRTGANLQETILTPTNVNKDTFGKLYSRNVQGRIFAQPLYVPNVVINGVAKNVVYVATMHNMVYAFDADDTSPNASALWVADSARLGTPLSYQLFKNPSNGIDECKDVGPEIGIASTPAIDPSTNTMYIVVKADATGAPDHSGIGFWIRALDLATGVDKQPPKKLEASAPDATTTDASGKVTKGLQFEPFWLFNRPGLLLANGKLIVAFGSTCDFFIWHGWILSYDAKTLEQSGALVTTPNTKPVRNNKGERFDIPPSLGGMGGVWQGGMGLSADSQSAYAIIGNGDVGLVDANGKGDADYGKNLGNSFVKIDIATLRVQDWFTPFNAAWMNLRDFDLGASGALLLPDGISLKPLMVGGGKQGILYVVDRTPDKMGKMVLTDVIKSLTYPWNAPNDEKQDRQIEQKFVATDRHEGIGINSFYNIHGSPVFWQGAAGSMIYIQGEQSDLKAFAFNKKTGKFGSLSGEAGVAAAVHQSFLKGMPGGMLSLSANGAKDGIVWVTHLGDYQDTQDKLYEGLVSAFAADPANGQLVELWNSNMVPERDHAGSPGKFAPPTIANGKVFVASNGYNYTEKDYLVEDHSLLQVYGLLGTQTQTQTPSSAQ